MPLDAPVMKTSSAMRLTASWSWARRHHGLAAAEEAPLPGQVPVLEALGLDAQAVLDDGDGAVGAHQLGVGQHLRKGCARPTGRGRPPAPAGKAAQAHVAVELQVAAIGIAARQACGGQGAGAIGRHGVHAGVVDLDGVVVRVVAQLAARDQHLQRAVGRDAADLEAPSLRSRAHGAARWAGSGRRSSGVFLTSHQLPPIARPSAAGAAESASMACSQPQPGQGPGGHGAGRYRQGVRWPSSSAV